MIKRCIDVLASATMLIVAGPIVLLVALLILVRLGSPVFFVQERPGLQGRLFNFYKFRTMTNERDSDGNLLPDENRMTGLGRWLRRSSLDELPQLLNVLKGDMSLVGPRPLLTEYLPLYSRHQARRHDVKPGITGWAQVNGRNNLSWQEKFELDIWYVDHRSILLDLRILCMTVARVAKSEGISESGRETMSRFRGDSGNGGSEI